MIEWAAKEIKNKELVNSSFKERLADVSNFSTLEECDKKFDKMQYNSKKTFSEVEKMESQDITGCSDDTKDSIESLKESDSYTDAEGDNTFSEMIEIPKKGLSDIDKTVLQAMTGWSDKIIDSIGSFEEARIYIKADLKEVTVNDKPCLIKKDIDMSQKDEMGRTNEQRMEKGLAPLDKNGNSLELHHIGQKKDSPLAELTKEEHRGIGNDAILHDKTKDSEINRNEFNTERKNHWKDRLECTTND